MRLLTMAEIRASFLFQERVFILAIKVSWAEIMLFSLVFTASPTQRKASLGNEELRDRRSRGSVGAGSHSVYNFINFSFCFFSCFSGFLFGSGFRRSASDDKTESKIDNNDTAKILFFI